MLNNIMRGAVALTGAIFAVGELYGVKSRGLISPQNSEFQNLVFEVISEEKA